MAGATGMRYNYNRPDLSESPLFEREIGDDYAELQHARIILEQQQQRILKLEKINMDLEVRLEEQAKQSMAVEAECIAIDRKWAARCQKLEDEIAKWKKECEKEQHRNGQLREQLSRTEKELYVILQRSYELRRGQPGAGPGGPSGRPLDISGKGTGTAEPVAPTIKRSENSSGNLANLYQVAKVLFPFELQFHVVFTYCWHYFVIVLLL